MELVKVRGLVGRVRGLVVHESPHNGTNTCVCERGSTGTYRGNCITSCITSVTKTNTGYAGTEENGLVSWGGPKLLQWFYSSTAIN